MPDEPVVSVEALAGEFLESLGGRIATAELLVPFLLRARSVGYRAGREEALGGEGRVVVEILSGSIFGPGPRAEINFHPRPSRTFEEGDLVRLSASFGGGRGRVVGPFHHSAHPVKLIDGSESRQAGSVWNVAPLCMTLIEEGGEPAAAERAEQHCRNCGCTEANACVLQLEDAPAVYCRWVGQDLCSACVPGADPHWVHPDSSAPGSQLAGREKLEAALASESQGEPGDKRRPMRCPTCNAPCAQRFPATAFEGEALGCPDEWHLTDPLEPPTETMRALVLRGRKNFDRAVVEETPEHGGDGDWPARLEKAEAERDIEKMVVGEGEEIIGCLKARLSRAEKALEEATRPSISEEERAALEAHVEWLSRFNPDSDHWRNLRALISRLVSAPPATDRPPEKLDLAAIRKRVKELAECESDAEAIAMVMGSNRLVGIVSSSASPGVSGEVGEADMWKITSDAHCSVLMRAEDAGLANRAAANWKRRAESADRGRDEADAQRGQARKQVLEELTGEEARLRAFEALTEGNFFSFTHPEGQEEYIWQIVDAVVAALHPDQSEGERQ